MLIDL